MVKGSRQEYQSLMENETWELVKLPSNDESNLAASGYSKLNGEKMTK